MNAKFLFKTAVLCLAMLAGCISFASCSEDDDATIEEDTNKLENVKIDYSIDLTENWFKYFDIELSYNIGAEEKTMVLTEDWDCSITIPYTGETNYYCNVIAKPKAEVPAFDADSTYLFGKESHARVTGILKDGSVDSNFSSSLTEESGTLNVGGAAMEAYTQQEFTLLKFSYTPGK